MDVLKSIKLLDNRNITFHFAGKFFNEKDKKGFESFIIENELSEKVVYHGVVNGKAKKDLLEICDIFVLPTYYPKEGQPISIIEAMGNGLAIITTNHAGIPDLISSDNGKFVNPCSATEISNAISNLINNRTMLQALAKRNRKIVVEKL
ncbi:glycosyltransferase family 4 protein, partial [Kitasatospora sp. SC0581]|uniref:glycosyltransferase family 4 protein n=1 Tax=Kitasatospora sp. SC0581 TaxID=3394360 RepID=UPI003A890F66